MQASDPDYEGGANKPSLNQARANYAQCGAMEERFVGNVRPPREAERPSPTQ